MPPLSIDMSLPALVPIAKAMGVTANLMGLTLSLFMAGFALGPLIYGPAADRLGRVGPCCWPGWCCSPLAGWARR